MRRRTREDLQTNRLVSPLHHGRGRHPAGADGEAVDVRVYSHVRPTHVEQQHARDGLGANALEPAAGWFELGAMRGDGWRVMVIVARSRASKEVCRLRRFQCREAAYLLAQLCFDILCGHITHVFQRGPSMTLVQEIQNVLDALCFCLRKPGTADRILELQDLTHAHLLPRGKPVEMAAM